MSIERKGKSKMINLRKYSQHTSVAWLLVYLRFPRCVRQLAPEALFMTGKIYPRVGCQEIPVVLSLVIPMAILDVIR